MKDDIPAMCETQVPNTDYRCLPPNRLFNMRKIANGSLGLLKEDPLKRARMMIRLGIAELATPNSRAARL